VVERTFAHLGRYRRLAKDFEHMVECAVATSSPPRSTSCSSVWLPLRDRLPKRALATPIPAARTFPRSSLTLKRRRWRG
jgi:hypothetical protein